MQGMKPPGFVGTARVSEKNRPDHFPARGGHPGRYGEAWSCEQEGGDNPVL